MKKEKQNTIIIPDKLKGLTTAQATEKLASEGLNMLSSSKPKNFFSTALGVIKKPIFILLVACGSFYLVFGDLQEVIMLLCFVLIIKGIEFFQQKKIKKTLDALKDMVSPRGMFIRDGVETCVADMEVVTDDLIISEEGDRVPANATVTQSVNLLVDESLLTDESASARKSDWDEKLGITQPDGDDLPFI